MKPKFSILIPLYNEASYIKKVLESILTQSYMDWDCIIIDDGSTDDSACIAQSFISSLSETGHSTIRIIRQPNSFMRWYDVYSLPILCMHELIIYWIFIIRNVQIINNPQKRMGCSSLRVYNTLKHQY